MKTFSPVRAACVFILVIALFVVLLGRVAYLETTGRQETGPRADRQQHQSQALQARRGGVFDSNGLLLAGTIQTRTLFVDPKFMYDVYQQDGHTLIEMDDAIRRLAKAIDKDAFELAQMLSDRSTSAIREGRREPR